MLYFCIAVASVAVVTMIGILAAIYWHKKTANGTLKINTNDPDGPYLFLELSKEDLTNIVHKKQVVLNVEIISQK